MWPLIKDIIISHSTDISSNNVVLEGSAILPELIVNLNFDKVSSIWLTASNEFLRQRIYVESKYKIKSPHEQMLVDKFWERTCLHNNLIIETVNRLGLISLNIEEIFTLDELMNQCLLSLYS